MKLVNGLRTLIGLIVVATSGVYAAGPSGNEGEYTVAREVARSTSRPIRDILLEQGNVDPTNPRENVIPNKFLDLDDLVSNPPTDAPLPPAQRSFSGFEMPPVDMQFNGLNRNFGGGGTPPDTTGDAGPDHFFQWVNTSWALYDKDDGSLVSGPNAGNVFFNGMGNACASTNAGDPLVLWDDQARRWVVSQFAFFSTSSPPWLQCVAVSTGEDPLGTYHQYAFSYDAWGFNDYGKMGVWTTIDGEQNAYLFSMHEFAGGASFSGTSFAVVERDAMLNGESAQFIRFGGLNEYGAIPFHVEGDFPLKSGTCPMFVHFSSGTPGYNLWKMCVDWDEGSADFNPTPTFIESGAYQIGLSGIPQAEAGAPELDDFGSNTMYIAALRSFGPTGPGEAYGVINHSVDVGGDQAGGRWIHFGIPQGVPGLDFKTGFENFVPSASVAPQMRIIEQGTYAPDEHSRWMGGINIDQSGNIAFGYNVASSTLNPEIRIAGRRLQDPSGMLRDEAQCTPTGTGAQTGLFGGRARWGDYATMAVDPDDQCTFWFTGEYYPVTSFGTWDTRVCSIKFDTCGDADYILETIPSNTIPVCGADASADVRVAEFGTLGENVTLSTGSAPGGVSLNFGTNPVAAGATSQVTLSGSAALADGDYSVTVEGSSSLGPRFTDILFGVSATTPAQTTLIGPANGVTGAPTRPTLGWFNASGANEYLVEVAEDMAFTQIVESAVWDDTVYTLTTLLDEETTYYWRVTSLNYCGSGATSDIRSFTTGLADECPFGIDANILFEDDMSDDSVPWVLDNAQGGADTMWNKEVPPAGTGLTTRAWWAENSSVASDQRLVTPPISLPPSDYLLVIWDAYHQYETDGDVDCWDGGSVEVRYEGGLWQPLDNSENLADPFPGQLSSGNPAQGNYGWCRQPAGGNSVRTVFDLANINLPPRNPDGDNEFEIRFRSSSDGNTVGPAPAGWGIDNVQVISCFK